MAWQKAIFKDKQVWMSVTDSGAPAVEGGRVPIRYSPSPGAKVYRAGAARVAAVAGAPVEALDSGQPAPEQGAQTGAAASKRRSGGRGGSGFGKAGTRTAQQQAMAADAARSLLAGLDEDTVVCFTDGACHGNPGPAGSGAVVVLPEGRRGEGSLSLGHGTNNIAELSAIGLALDLLDEARVDPSAPVALMTDSSYSHGVLCRGWKAKANAGLIADLRERLAARPGLTVHWIAGHVGTAGNERADDLAGEGVAGVSGVAWQ